jgi:hypothetical protein
VCALYILEILLFCKLIFEALFIYLLLSALVLSKAMGSQGFEKKYSKQTLKDARQLLTLLLCNSSMFMEDQSPNLSLLK